MTTAKLVVAALMLPMLILAAIFAAAGVIVHRLHSRRAPGPPLR